MQRCSSISFFCNYTNEWNSRVSELSSGNLSTLPMFTLLPSNSTRGQKTRGSRVQDGQGRGKRWRIAHTCTHNCVVVPLSRLILLSAWTRVSLHLYPFSRHSANLHLPGGLLPRFCVLFSHPLLGLFEHLFKWFITVRCM